MSQVNHKGEMPASSPALDAELRRRSSAERRAARPSDAPQRVSKMTGGARPIERARIAHFFFRTASHAIRDGDWRYARSCAEQGCATLRDLLSGGRLTAA